MAEHLPEALSIRRLVEPAAKVQLIRSSCNPSFHYAIAGSEDPLWMMVLP